MYKELNLHCNCARVTIRFREAVFSPNPMWPHARSQTIRHLIVVHVRDQGAAR